MRLLLGIFASVLLAAPADSSVTAYVKDATSFIQPFYQSLARKMAISPVSVPTSGNDFELMRNGTRYSELLFQDIEAAGKSIDLEVLLFCEDKEGLRVRDSLISKVRQGVEVRYIYDNFGNFFDSIFDGRPLFGGFHRSIGRGGIKVRSFSPLWAPDYTYTTPGCRNHRKINIIDDKIAYVGGMNFSEGSMAGWGDTQLRITGPAVQSLEGLFVSDWNRLAGKKDRFTLSVEGPATDGGGKILQVIPDGHDQPAYMMEEVFRWLLENAKEYIWFETPYYLPPAPVLKALGEAAMRGIDVRIILPGESDLPSLEPAFRSRLEESLEYGIKIIYRKPPFVHSKTLVCDDYVTVVGSTNIDKISLLGNQEVNVIIYDTPTALEHKEFLTSEQEGAFIVDRSLIDSWDSSERFKQFMLGLIGRWL